MLAVFETGVRYHLIHALALLAVAWASTRWTSAAIRAAGWLFVVGILLFSGSLYALTLTGSAGAWRDHAVRRRGLHRWVASLAWGAWRGR